MTYVGELEVGYREKAVRVYEGEYCTQRWCCANRWGKYWYLEVRAKAGLMYQGNKSGGSSKMKMKAFCWVPKQHLVSDGGARYF